MIETIIPKNWRPDKGIVKTKDISFSNLFLKKFVICFAITIPIMIAAYVLIGNITEKDKNPYLHIHINFSNEEGNCFGGHLVKAIISATCEVIITESIIDEIENSVNREFNKEIGLNLLKF